MTETLAPEIVQIEPEMETIVDFINDNEITMHVLLAHENPYRKGENQKEQIHWSCQITCKDRNLVIYISKGLAARRWCQPPQNTADIPLHVPLNKVGEPYDGPMPPFDNKKDSRTFNFCSYAEPPFLIEVLDILAKDIRLIEQTGHFHNWAIALKTSPDSLHARRVFDIVAQQRVDLYALLGEGLCHQLIYEIDRLPTVSQKTEEKT